MQNLEEYVKRVNANDFRQQILAILFLVIFVLTGILFIRWFRRAYYNLHQMVQYLYYAEGWAAGSWFVPIINLYRPYRIMKELFMETNHVFQKKLPEHDTTIDTNFQSLLGFWWSSWILAGVLNSVSFRLYMMRDVEMVQYGIIFSIAGGIIIIFCAMLTIRVIKKYSKMEDNLFEFQDDLL